MTLKEYKDLLAFVLNHDVDSENVVEVMAQMDKDGSIDQKVLAQMVAINTRYLLANAEKAKEKQKTKS